jgi:hypothetical protein
MGGSHVPASLHIPSTPVILDLTNMGLVQLGSSFVEAVVSVFLLTSISSAHLFLILLVACSVACLVAYFQPLLQVG